jgi:hypothetical protein
LCGDAVAAEPEWSRPYPVSFARLKLVLGRCLHTLKLVRRLKAGHMLLATAAWLAKAREK